MKTLRILVLFSILSLVAGSQSMAATDIYFPNPPYYPDLAGQLVDVSYSFNASSGAFSASGLTTDYTDPSGNESSVVNPDSYTLLATIDNSGATPILMPGGTLSIYGDIGDGNNDTLLLSGDLVTGAAGTAFGYGDNGNDQFQFRFTVTGGTLENVFGNYGAPGGIILEAFFDSGSGDVAFTGSWGTSFDSNGSQNGQMDSFMVPEPSSILLVSAGVLCMIVRRRLKMPRG